MYYTGFFITNRYIVKLSIRNFQLKKPITTTNPCIMNSSISKALTILTVGTAVVSCTNRAPKQDHNVRTSYTL